MSPALVLVAQQCQDSTMGRGWRGHPFSVSASTAKQGSLGNQCRSSHAAACPLLYTHSHWDEPGWGSQRAGGGQEPSPGHQLPCLPAAACTPTTSSATATWPGSRSGCASVPQSGSSPSVPLQPSSAASTWPRSRRTSSAAPVRGMGEAVGARAGIKVGGTKPVPSRQPTSTPCREPQFRA